MLDVKRLRVLREVAARGSFSGAADALAALKAGDCDLGITLEASFRPLEDEQIAKTMLLDDPMFLVLARDHPLAHKPRLALEDLAEEQCIQGTLGACPDTSILIRS